MTPAAMPKPAAIGTDVTAAITVTTVVKARRLSTGSVSLKIQFADGSTGNMMATRIPAIVQNDRPSGTENHA